ncbi:MFS transporter, partial [bacterium]|nr:MFS transporter [bacterium]
MDFSLIKTLNPLRQVPQQLRRNFWLFFSDIAWFGLVSGSTVAFLNIYVAHIGARPTQIGLINAAPPIVSMLFSLSFGAWMVSKPSRRVVVLNSALMRLYYLPLILLPTLLVAPVQIWLIIVMTFLMSVPGTGVQVGFPVLFSEAVPAEWRAFVAGTRNAIFAIVCILTSLLCGFILENLPFPHNYQIVFVIGFGGAAMTIVSLYFIRPTAPDIGSGGTRGIPGERLVELRQLLSEPVTRTPANTPTQNYQQKLRMDILKSPYNKVLTQIFAFHLMQFLPMPLFPIFAVNVLKVSDQVYSIGNAIFYSFVFVSSTLLVRLVRKVGNQRTTALGLISLAIFPLIQSLAQNQWLFLFAHIFGGAGWGLANGSMYNYGLEKASPNPPAPYLAWFTLFANAGMLLGALCGPVIANWLGIRWALALFGGLRLITGIIIARWK